MAPVCVCAPVSAHCSGSVGACIGVNNLTPGTLLPGLQQLMLICRCQVSSLHYVRCQLTFANVATWLIIASSQHWMSQWGYSGPHSWWRRLVNAGIKRYRELWFIFNLEFIFPPFLSNWLTQIFNAFTQLFALILFDLVLVCLYTCFTPIPVFALAMFIFKYRFIVS